jgi:hypothetical protein
MNEMLNFLSPASPILPAAGLRDYVFDHDGDDALSVGSGAAGLATTSSVDNDLIFIDLGRSLDESGNLVDLERRIDLNSVVDKWRRTHGTDPSDHPSRSAKTSQSMTAWHTKGIFIPFNDDNNIDGGRKDDDDNRRGKGWRAPPSQRSQATETQLQLACPYYKHDGVKFWSCRSSAMETISGLR